MNDIFSSMQNPTFVIDGDDEAIPAGMYKAEFVSYEIKEHTFQDGADGDDPRLQVQLVARISEGDFADQELLGWCSLPKNRRLSSRAKLAQWGKAILGDTGKFDLDAILDKPCQIIVKTVESNRNDGTLFSKIDSVFPVTGPPKPKPQPVPDF